MNRYPVFHKLGVLLSALMIAVGGVLAIWALTHLPGAKPPQLVQQARTAGEDALAAPLDGEQTDADDAGAPARTPLVVGLAPGVPITLTRTTSATAAAGLEIIPAPADAVSATLRLTWEPGGRPAYHMLFAAATRFDTIDPQITWSTLKETWAGSSAVFSDVVVLTDTLPALTGVLGRAGETVTGVATTAEMIEAAWQATPTLTLLPFDRLDPRLVVLQIDGQNPVENANRFDEEGYPFIATLYAHGADGIDASGDAARKFLAALPPGNRLADRLTVIAMTGVTAMARETAAQMDVRGPAWPAEVVGPELAAADITAISNEIPFVEGCETNRDPNNFNFCSPPDYMETLTASGADIIGLTGNHQNDFGLDNALKSLQIYEEAGLPVYGGGRDKEAAFRPLLIEHNGNKLAFLGANSYGPKFAWATDSTPGSAQFDLAILSATIRSLKEKGLADIVLPELQYQESYDIEPLFDQRQDFKALVRAGADIVTGVQSHVTQGMEFLDGKLILYGLGNLYFDQMWSQVTREGLIVKHTIHDGRHISTQLLPTLLYDFGQPRWMTPDERRSLLERVFAASSWE